MACSAHCVLNLLTLTMLQAQRSPSWSLSSWLNNMNAIHDD